ncbi:MAG: 5'-methylthioadenosine/adenosylhomocysteine nucleosidase [Prevotella sp.]|uniref:adenosylhomocysteine nucleosidase n=1 Tax=Hallella faecis TaxID=2841596 RepID=A0ABV1FQ00_9BACT|nr:MULTISPECIES: 5'-methylthioadenosine/adenosylhomocysteine nucleosidase [Hallella]MBP6272977.1 5'-methylthioadenosine/adenosylhomocysteine nucleosidase [Prevotella sp.]MBU0290301.1 5'-methylthioadenosine/adenosylhomocysteine nucleosidase [Hallella faecis]MDD7144968.1 5'-methylthioadenosine/adenosylhomocysteine nucleosidase [Hallella sp.]MDR3999960.1 5'-methylthioadenosine/adenosylhomocysteine nucleosidase [Hallella sp.]MDY5925517.1 5'-methylthioadenosine/adenosylhomocysteine nucleosidase [Ha
MKKIGIIVAMDKEFAQLKTLLDDCRTERHHFKDFVIGTLDGAEIILQQCGIGKVNSAIGAVEMIDCYQPDLVMSTGVAGGADVTLSPLDVVVAAECTYHDAYCGEEVARGQIMGQPARFVSPKALVDKALALSGVVDGIKIRSGLTVSGEWFVDSREKMRQILADFPDAVAVDMESCSIAQTCHIYQTPFISFRIISDVPLKDHKGAQYFDFWNRMAEGSFEITRHYLKALLA